MFRVRSPLLPESSFLSFPPGTEMFHFPGFAPAALWIQAGVTAFSTPPGFPIRRPPDRSLVGGSPRHFAATRVLHRLLAPRHPSRALSSLQFSNFSRPPSRPGEASTHKPSHLSPSRERLVTSLAPESLVRVNATRVGHSVEIELFYVFCFQGARTMELTGLEPATSSLQSWRSPN